MKKQVSFLLFLLCLIVSLSGCAFSETDRIEVHTVPETTLAYDNHRYEDNMEIPLEGEFDLLLEFEPLNTDTSFDSFRVNLELDFGSATLRIPLSGVSSTLYDKSGTELSFNRIPSKESEKVTETPNSLWEKEGGFAHSDYEDYAAGDYTPRPITVTLYREGNILYGSASYPKLLRDITFYRFAYHLPEDASDDISFRIIGQSVKLVNTQYAVAPLSNVRPIINFPSAIINELLTLVIAVLLLLLSRKLSNWSSNYLVGITTLDGLVLIPCILIILSNFISKKNPFLVQYLVKYFNQFIHFDGYAIPSFGGTVGNKVMSYAPQIALVILIIWFLVKVKKDAFAGGVFNLRSLLMILPSLLLVGSITFLGAYPWILLLYSLIGPLFDLFTVICVLLIISKADLSFLVSAAANGVASIGDTGGSSFSDSYTSNGDSFPLHSAHGNYAYLRTPSGDLIEVRPHGSDGLVCDDNGNLYRP